MKKHMRYLLQGVVLVAPLAITIYLIVVAVIWLDGPMRWLLMHAVGEERAKLPIFYPIRAFGFIFMMCVIYLIGRLTNLWLFRTIAEGGESLLERIPLLKTVYTSVRDLMQFVVGDKKRGASRPVLYNVPGTGIKMMGLMTCGTPPEALRAGNEGMACVFFPLSYSIGGFTVLVPADKLEAVQGTSAAMLRLVVTGGVSGYEAPQQPDSPK